LSPGDDGGGVRKLNVSLGGLPPGGDEDPDGSVDVGSEADGPK
jgi:hypothetical protein